MVMVAFSRTIAKALQACRSPVHELIHTTILPRLDSSVDFGVADFHFESRTAIRVYTPINSHNLPLLQSLSHSSGGFNILSIWVN